MPFWLKVELVGVEDVIGFDTTRFVAGEGGGGMAEAAVCWIDVMSFGPWP